MAKLLKLRRGSTSQHSSFTGAEGEVTVDTDKDTLVVHDGSTQGGFPLLRASGGSENISTTGTLTTGDHVTLSGQNPHITFTDTNHNPDYEIYGSAGNFKIWDSTSSTSRLTVNSDGHIDIPGRVDALNGVAVTGDLTVTSTLPVISLIDSDNNSDYNIKNHNGVFKIADSTNGSDRMAILANGSTTFYSSVNLNSGVAITGNASVTGDITSSSSNSITGFDAITLSAATPVINFTETDGNPDYRVIVAAGVMKFQDVTNSFANRLVINTDGHVDIPGNLDCGANLNVTGTASIDNGSLSITGGEGNSALLRLIADQGDDNGDGWTIQSEQDENDLTFKSNTSGSYVDKLKIKSNGQLEPQGPISTGSNISIGGSAFLDFTSSNDEKISLGGSANPYIRFEENSTDKAYIQWSSSGSFYMVNQEADSYIRFGSNLVFKDGGGSERTVWHSGNDGSGSSLDADTVDGIQGANFLRSDTGDAASGDIAFQGGAGAVTLSAGSDMRLESGNWTGDATKIQHHDNILYIQGGTNGSHCIIFRDPSGANRCQVDQNGFFTPMTNNTYDLGTASLRWRNIYTQDLQLSNEAIGDNGIDGTWGNFTIVEGESDLFLKNNRSGKTYKFNLTEVS